MRDPTALLAIIEETPLGNMPSWVEAWLARLLPRAGDQQERVFRVLSRIRNKRAA